MSNALRALVTLCLVTWLAGCSRPEPAPEPIRAVRTMKLAPATVQGAFDYAAEVRSRTESRLAFRVPGKMLSRSAELGQKVRAGQVLARLDPQDLQLSREAAMAALQAAQGAAVEAQADLQRFKGLRAQGFISEAELARRETAATTARSQALQAQAQARMQLNQVGYSELVAPADGVVTGIDAEPGAVLSAGAPVLRLALAGPRDAVFSVPEVAVSGLRALRGKQGALKVTLWGRDGSFAATVREVAAAADPQTRTFLVKADLGDAPVDLGQTATVSVNLPPVGGALRLPLTALLQLGGETVVWRLDGESMTVHARPVQVAGADGNQAIIGAGLAPDMEVVTAGVHVLTEGQKVTRYQPAKMPAGDR